MERSIEEIDNLEAANNEVMRKIGRNMLLFQQMEGLLKYLLANSFAEGSISSIRENREKYVSQIGKKSLGQLVGEFCDRSIKTTDTSETEESTREPDEAYIKFQCSIECEQEEYENRKRILADIVEERNNLIHHLLPTYDSKSFDCLKKLEGQLDAQREQVLKEIKYLTALIEAFNEARKHLAVFLESEEYLRLLEGLLPGESRLDRLLSDLASLAARPDGWAALATAGNLVSELNPVRLKDALEEQGLSSLKGLKKLIEKSDRFELMEEITSKGSFWLYRTKVTHESCEAHLDRWAER